MDMHPKMSDRFFAKLSGFRKILFRFMVEVPAEFLSRFGPRVFREPFLVEMIIYIMMVVDAMPYYW